MYELADDLKHAQPQMPSESKTDMMARIKEILANEKAKQEKINMQIPLKPRPDMRALQGSQSIDSYRPQFAVMPRPQMRPAVLPGQEGEPTPKFGPGFGAQPAQGPVAVGGPRPGGFRGMRRPINPNGPRFRSPLRPGGPHFRGAFRPMNRVGAVAPAAVAPGATAPTGPAAAAPAAPQQGVAAPQPGRWNLANLWNRFRGNQPTATAAPAAAPAAPAAPTNQTV
jgi:hypothetical protein